MKKMLRRMVAAVMCVAVAFSAVACAQKVDPPDEAPPSETQPGISYAKLMSDMNRQVMSDLAEAIPNILWWGTTGGHVVAYGANERDPNAPHPHLLADIDPENETFTCVSLQLPEVSTDPPGLAAALAAEEAEGDTAQRGSSYDVPTRTVAGVLETSAKKLYLLLVDTLHHYNQDGGGYTTVTVAERAVTLCNLAEDGTLQPVAQLQIPQEYLLQNEVAENCLLGPDDTLWLSATDYLGGQACLLRFSLEDGRLLTTLPLPERTVFRDGALARLGLDSLLVLTVQHDPQTGGTLANTNQFYILAGIDGETPTWQDPLPLTGETMSDARLLPCPGDRFIKDTPLLYDRQGAYSADLETGEVTQRADWVEYVLQGAGLTAVFGLTEGRYLAVTQPTGDTASQLQVLTPLDPAVVAGREVLRFGKIAFSGCAVYDPIQDAIAKFNATSTEYYVEIVDLYHTEAKLRDGEIESFSTSIVQDILDGNLPDILMLDLGIDTWVTEKGATIDLYPYIDADPELSREDFFPAMLTKTEVDGKLASITASYTIDTLAGDSALLGEKAGWTPQEYLQLCAEQGNPAPIAGMSRSSFLDYFAGHVFVDGSSRQAHFDTPEFVALLENSAAYPETLDWNWFQEDPKPKVENGEVLLTRYYMDNWGDLVDPAYAYGQGFVFKGFPTQTGGIDHGISSMLRLGISYQCEYPEGAWELLRLFLLPEFQDKLGGDDFAHLGFPMRRDSLVTSGQASRQPKWEWQTEGIYLPSHMQNRGFVPPTEQWIPLTDLDVEKLIALVESTDGIETESVFDETMAAILEEEAAYYYNGARTAEEAAKIIQNRVQTYLDEQS